MAKDAIMIICFSPVRVDRTLVLEALGDVPAFTADVLEYWA